MTTCTHHLWGEPDGLVCTVDGAHNTHQYVASAGADLADEGMSDG